MLARQWVLANVLILHSLMAVTDKRSPALSSDAMSHTDRSNSFEVNAIDR